MGLLLRASGVGLVWLLAGCHLLFPYRSANKPDAPGKDSSPPDGFRRDASSLDTPQPDAPKADATATKDTSGSDAHPDYTWTTPLTGGLANDLQGIWGSSGGDVFVVGTGGTILKCNGIGTSCTLMTSNTSNHLWGVWGISGGDVFAVGASGTILKSNDDGSTWIKMNSNTSETLWGVWGSSGIVFAVGASGTILKSNDDGSTWIKMNSNTSETLWGVWGSTADQPVWTVAYAEVFSSFDGLSWNAVPLNGVGTINFLKKIWVSQNGMDVFAAAPIEMVWTGSTWVTQTCILHKHSTGWQNDKVPSGTFLNGVWGRSSNDVFAVGLGGTILHYNGSSWSKLDGPASVANLNAAWGAADGGLFLVGAGGAIFHGTPK